MKDITSGDFFVGIMKKNNSARIVAGFCWPWSEPNSDGSLVNDVCIGDFAMPWEKKDSFWKWATDDTGMEQVGTVHRAQGFEFDYIADERVTIA